MKALIFAGIVALAMTSAAQTTQSKPASGKKPAKAVSQKVSNRAGEPVGKISETPAVNAAPSVEAAPASGTATSVTTVTAPAAPAKKWGASVAVNPSSDFATPSQVGTLTTIGGSYKVTDTWKMGLNTTFQSVAIEGTTAAQRAMVDVTKNNFRSAYTSLTGSRALPAMFGSDAMNLSVMYRHYSKDALMTRDGAGAAIVGHADANLVVPFTINPKWSATVLGHFRHTSLNNDGLNRVMAQPSIGYAITDKVSVYQAAGLMYQTTKAEELRWRRDRMILETGIDIAAAKGLSINLNVYQDKSLRGRGGEATSFSLYKPTLASSSSFDVVGYDATISYSF